MKIYQLQDAQQRMQLPFSSLQHEWHGSRLEQAFEYRLSFDHSRFYFEVRRSKPCRVLATAKAGEFTPLLWHEDVAEMFIYNTKAGCYREINLAANASWWVELFAGKRQVHPDYMQSTPECSAHADAQGWSACAQIPLEWLAEGLGAQTPANDNSDVAAFIKEHLRFAVCAILESPQQLFVTTTPHQPQDTPDFHCFEKFLAAEVINAGDVVQA